MKILRFVLVLAVIAYAGWLAWPFASPFFEGAPLDVATSRAGAMIEAGGGIPQAALWVGAVLLYVVAAVLLGSGNPKAVVAYFLGFLADAALRLAIDRSGGSSNASISADSYTVGRSRRTGWTASRSDLADPGCTAGGGSVGRGFHPPSATPTRARPAGRLKLFVRLSPFGLFQAGMNTHIGSGG